MECIPAAVDCVISGLRHRIGLCISRIDHIPAYGRLMISMDAAAVAWVRSAITAPPDSKIIARITNNKQKAIDFDVSATRHLVLRIQGLLLSVPTANRDIHWPKRKNKCDVLLSISTSLANYLNSITYN